MEISEFCYSNLGTGGRYVVSFVPQPLGIVPLFHLRGWVDSGPGLGTLGKIKMSYS